MCARTLVRGGDVGVLFGADHAAPLAGMTTAQACSRPEALAEAFLAAHGTHGHDVVVVHAHAFVSLEALGGWVHFPTHGPPLLRSRPPSLPSRPISPWEDGRVPVLLEASCLVRDRLAAEACVAVSVTGPLTLAGGILGEARVLGVLPETPPEVASALACAEESVSNLVRAAAREGLGVMVAEPLASLVSPQVFRRVVAPPLSRLLALGATILHICGDSSHLLSELEPLGAPAVSLDRVDLARASHLLGTAVVMGGTPVDTVHRGPPRLVRAQVRALGRRVPKPFAPCTGCDLVWDTPCAHVQAFVRGAREAVSLGEGWRRP